VEEYEGKVDLKVIAEKKIQGYGKVDGGMTMCGERCAVVRGAAEEEIFIPVTEMDVTTGKSKIRLVMEIPDTPGPDYKCSLIPGSNSTVGDVGGWSMNVLLFKWDVSMIGNDLFAIKHWDIVNEDGVFARKKWSGATDVYDNEETTIELIHVPKKSN
jgi:hypothetical protein